jgi:hypothetical protein
MNILKSGNYMNVGEVDDYLCHINLRPTLVDIIKKVCPIHECKLDIYYNTSDLKSVMRPDLFRELECNVITHMVIEGQ